MQLEFNVIGQRLNRIDTATVVANSRGFLTAHFNLPDEYIGTVSAYFKIIQNGTPVGKPMPLNSEFICQVPEAVIKAGMLSVSLSSTDTNLYIPTNEVQVQIIDSGVPTELLPEPDGTIDQYADFQALANEVNSKHTEVLVKAAAASMSEVNAKASEVNSAVSETNAQTSETNAKISETNAKGSETVTQQAMTDYLNMVGKDIATLVGGKIPMSQIPATATQEIYAITNEADKLALVAQRGDLAELIESVEGIPTIVKSWQLLGDGDPAIDTNWIVWGTSYAVQAGNASASTYAQDAGMINGHRVVTFDTNDLYKNAVKDANTLYLVKGV